MPLCGVVGNTENPEGEIVIQGLLKEKVLLLFLPKSGVGSDEPVSQYGLWSIQVEGTKLERFLHKKQKPLRILLNFEFWINGNLLSAEI